MMVVVVIVVVMIIVVVVVEMVVIMVMRMMFMIMIVGMVKPAGYCCSRSLGKPEQVVFLYPADGYDAGLSQKALGKRVDTFSRNYNVCPGVDYVLYLGLDNHCLPVRV